VRADDPLRWLILGLLVWNAVLVTIIALDRAGFFRQVGAT